MVYNFNQTHSKKQQTKIKYVKTKEKKNNKKKIFFNDKIRL
jgi:hypothetical protein